MRFRKTLFLGIAIISILTFTSFGKTLIRDNHSSQNAMKDGLMTIYMDSGNQFNEVSNESNGESFSVGYISSTIESINLNDVELNTSNSFYLQTSKHANSVSKDIYGQDVKIKINQQLLKTTFHCPNRINVSYNQKKYPLTLEEGMTFYWTPDKTSDNVMVRFVFNDVVGKTIQKQLIIKDNGHFTVPKNWLEELPENCYVLFTIQRTYEKIIKTEHARKIKVRSMSTASSTLRVP